MKKRHLWLTILALFSMVACSNIEVSPKHKNMNEIEENKVREVVWNYLQEHGTPYTKDDWIDAEVKIVSRNDNKVYAVSIKNALATPTVYVNPDTYKVIGVDPGS